MIDSIIAKSLGKIVLAAVCAALLAAVTILTTDITWWAVLVMLVLVLMSFAGTFAELKKAVAKGDIVAIYGHCISFENAENVIGRIQKNVLSYRFVSLAEDENTQSSTQENVASFYIKGKKGKFIAGESYCLLFKAVRDNSEYSEKNLIGYEIAKSSPVTISASSAELASIPEEVLVEASATSAPANIVYKRAAGKTHGL